MDRIKIEDPKRAERAIKKVCDATGLQENKLSARDYAQGQMLVEDPDKTYTHRRFIVYDGDTNYMWELLPEGVEFKPEAYKTPISFAEAQGMNNKWHNTLAGGYWASPEAQKYEMQQKSIPCPHKLFMP